MTLPTANTKLNVLVACESSGTVRDAFRKLGHNAWSCDLLPCDADPRFHIEGDVMKVLHNERVKGTDSQGRTETGRFAPGWKWDLIIAHPPCTYLCNSGVRWLWESVRPSRKNEHRWHQMRVAANFFLALRNANIPHVAVENPIMHRYAKACGIPQQTQIVQPYEHGHPESKATCLWLRGLPNLTPTRIVHPSKGSAMWKLPPSADRWKLRSKTYQGIADAMASQWSAYLLEQKANAAWTQGRRGYND